MPTTNKFPNGGYDVKVLRKEDVIKCIDDNIIDKDIALTLIKRLEIDAATVVQQGGWAGIPHLGSLRIPLHKKLARTEESVELVKEAWNTLDKQRYILFRKDLAGEYKKREKNERFFKYCVSMMANKNKILYKELIDTKGLDWTNVFMYVCREFEPIGGDSNRVKYARS